MDNLKIKPCPKCGRKPDIYRDADYEASGYGAWATIRCKPFLRMHKKVECGRSKWENALMAAIEEWNNSVEQ